MEGDSGKAIADLITVYDEIIDPEKPIELFDRITFGNASFLPITESKSFKSRYSRAENACIAALQPRK